MLVSPFTGHVSTDSLDLFVPTHKNMHKVQITAYLTDQNKWPVESILYHRQQLTSWGQARQIPLIPTPSFCCINVNYRKTS